MRRTAVAIAVTLLLVFSACSGDDDTATGDDATQDDTGADAPAVRFCDAYLDYIAAATPENLDQVEAAARDDAVTELADIIRTDDRTGRVLAAGADLEDLARSRCQSEWIAGAQGAGDAPSAAQALLDALVAGDALGARNVASANAIAVFEPWAPIEPDDELGTPKVVSVGDESFVIALDADSIAECQVATGVIIACTVASQPGS